MLRPHDDRRRLVGVRGGQCPRDYNGLNQRRDLSSGGNAKDGKDKKGREEEGLLDRLKKMMGDEIEKVSVATVGLTTSAGVQHEDIGLQPAILGSQC